MSKKTRKIIIIISFIFLWQIIYYLGIYPSTLFPNLVQVFKELIKGIKDLSILKSICYSLSILFKGIIITFIIAFFSVLLSEISSLANDFLEILITIAHPLPGIAIIPLVILWIGIGEKALLFIVVHAMLWPVVINLKSGVASISNIYIDLSHVFNLSTIDKIKHIYFMGILPHIFSGLKIAWARGWRALISSEMVFGVVGTASGLGWYIFKQRVFMNTAGLYAGLSVIILLGLIVEGIVFENIEKKLIGKWR